MLPHFSRTFGQLKLLPNLGWLFHAQLLPTSHRVFRPHPTDRHECKCFSRHTINREEETPTSTRPTANCSGHAKLGLILQTFADELSTFYSAQRSASEINSFTRVNTPSAEIACKASDKKVS